MPVRGNAAHSVLAAVSVSTAGALPLFLVGAVSVQIRADLHFGETALGVAVGTYLVAGALASVAAGRMVERIGAVRGMRLAAVLSASALAGIAAFARSWGALVALLALGGVAGAAAQPGSNLLIARAVSRGRQGTAFGIKQSAIPASMLLGGVAVPTVALTVGWRWAFVGAAALALASVATVPRRPALRPPERSTDDPALGDFAAQDTDDSPETPKGLWALAVAGGLGAAPANTLGAFLVASAVDAGVAEGAAGLLFAAGAATGLVARVTGGMVIDRLGRTDALPAVRWMLAGGAVGFALLAVHAAPLLVPGTLLAYGLGWGWPGLFNLSVVARHPSAPAAATGVTQTGIYLGAVTGPLVFGVLADHLGFGWGWTFSLAATLAAAVMVSAVARRRPAAPSSAPAVLGLETGG